MSILVLSSDEDAARSLCAALARSGQDVNWEQSIESARHSWQAHAPLVLVADAAMEQHALAIDELRRETPWARVYLMADPQQAPVESAIPVVPKPFDASEFAGLIARERELAELDRGRANLQAHVDELAMLVEECFEAIIGLEADGTIRSWNRGATALYGYTVDEVIGRHVELLEPDATALRRRLSAGSGPAQEIRRRNKDGSEVIVLLSLSPIGRSRASRLSFVEVSLDITQRRELERELEHSERLAALGRIAATMAHEINNPLSVVRASASYTQELALRISDQELAECASDLDLAVERIASFVQHVCGFARRERTQLSDTQLSHAIDMAVRLVRPKANEAGVSLHVQEGFSVRVPNDPPRLAQAVVNLLSNAIDAAADGGKNVWLRGEVFEQNVSIIVEDDGPGIANEVQESVFEPFSTTKPHGKGTGLGLAITKKIVDDHAGRVSLSARAGGGTHAELVLPNFVTREHSVLVLDADPLVRRAVATDLRREGFKLLSAASFEEARTQLKKQRVSVIVTDTRLSGKEGQELLSALRALDPRATVLLLTDDPSADRVLGADQVLARPWERSQLIDATRRLCLLAARDQG